MRKVRHAGGDESSRCSGSRSRGEVEAIFDGMLHRSKEQVRSLMPVLLRTRMTNRKLISVFDCALQLSLQLADNATAGSGGKERITKLCAEFVRLSMPFFQRLQAPTERLKLELRNTTKIAAVHERI